MLNTPNKITAADFDGWVQERGLYFPDEWDEHFTPILACSDPGETPLKGGAAGRAARQGLLRLHRPGVLPAAARGVPGAYRLFANLVSLGK